MTTLIASIALGYLLESLLVALALAGVVRQLGWRLPRIRSVLALALLFACLELVYLPAVIVLDATITVRNQSIADSLGLIPETPLLELGGFHDFDVLIWASQAIAARFVALMMNRDVHREA